MSMADLTLDDELRAVVFAQVQRLRERCGGRIPSTELMAGVSLRGERVPIWNYQKGIFRPAVLGRDGAALSAYDVHILGIDADARVHVRADVLEEVDGPMQRHGLQEVHESRLVLPRREEHRPNRDFLAQRFERFRAA